jgi:predicted helicase
VCFDAALTIMVYRLPSMFPTPHHDNVGMYVTGSSTHYDFGVIMTDKLPNLHLLDTGQFLPRWTYRRPDPPEDTLDLLTDDGDDVDEHGYVRVDNVTDGALAAYRRAYGDEVSKDDVVHYAYGLFHSPDYRSRYAADLRKSLPRIPLVAPRTSLPSWTPAGLSPACTSGTRPWTRTRWTMSPRPARARARPTSTGSTRCATRGAATPSTARP